MSFEDFVLWQEWLEVYYDLPKWLLAFDLESPK